MNSPTRAFDKFNSWPVALQILGGLAICFGVGAVAGLGWGLISFGVQAVTAGMLAEAK